VGVTRERVRQILLSEGLPTRKKRGLSEEQIRNLVWEYRKLGENERRGWMKKKAEELGVSYHEVYYWCVRRERRMIRKKEEYLRAIREVLLPWKRD